MSGAFGLTVIGVIFIVKGSEELIDDNLTDAVTDIVNDVNAVQAECSTSSTRSKNCNKKLEFFLSFFCLMVLDIIFRHLIYGLAEAIYRVYLTSLPLKLDFNVKYQRSFEKSSYTFFL